MLAPSMLRDAAAWLTPSAAVVLTTGGHRGCANGGVHAVGGRRPRCAVVAIRAPFTAQAHLALGRRTHLYTIRRRAAALSRSPTIAIAASFACPPDRGRGPRIDHHCTGWTPWPPLPTMAISWGQTPPGSLSRSASPTCVGSRRHANAGRPCPTGSSNRAPTLPPRPLQFLRDYETPVYSTANPTEPSSEARSEKPIRVRA